MTEGVFNCLIDEERTIAFAKAIAATVRPGDVVVDMGTGSGVLAMLAARAGVKKVYAVEIDQSNIANLDAVFRANKLEERIVLVHGDVCTVDLPEKVDVIIGEMIATALIEELQVPAMNNMLRFAKRGRRATRVLLSGYKTYIDLVNNPETYYGHSFKILRYEYSDSQVARKLRSKPFSDKQLISDVDFTRINTDLKVKQNLCIPATRRGEINGLRLSGETRFFDGSTLGASYAYSYPVILPIDTREVAKGQVLKVKIGYTICGGMKTLRYSVE
ncbi:MAG: 50S ribosomal protein L11 methyltransferase [Sulfuritalea sp.]|nr:50S ribosomal protein L11 methyltransferase [Sulfuritalea sp.]